MKRKIFFGCILGLLTIATIFVLVLFLKPESKDEKPVFKAIRKKVTKTIKKTHPVELAMEEFLKKLDDCENPLLTEQDLEKKLNALTEGNVEATYSLNISNAPSLQGKTVGIDGTLMRSMDGKKLFLNADVSVSRVKMLLANVYGDGDTLYVNLPEITGTDSILLNAKNIDQQINGSLLKEYLNVNVPSEVSLSLYESYPVHIPKQIWLDELLLKTFCTQNNYASESDTSEDKEQENIHDDAKDAEEKEDSIQKLFRMISDEQKNEREDENKSPYNVTVSEAEETENDETLEVGEEELILSTYEVQFEGIDGTFLISLDKDEKVRKIIYPKGYDYEGTILQKVGISFVGEESALDKVLVDVKGDVSKLQQNFTLKAEIADYLDIYVEMKQGINELSCSAIVNENSDYGFDFDIDYLKIQENDEGVIKVTGEVIAKPLTVEMPINTGEIVDLLHMKELEFVMTFLPWYENIEKRYGAYLDMLAKGQN